MRNRFGRTRVAGALLGAAVLCGGLLSACGLDTGYAVPYRVQPGSIAAVPALHDLPMTVGSKDFTENILLGFMTEYALSAAGAQVHDLTNIQGSNSSRQALQSGQIDVSWDYTGTGWLSFLGHDKPIADQRAQYEATAREDLRRNGLEWLPYSRLNNTYAFGVKDTFAAKHHLRTLSDMVALIRKDQSLGTFCLETEFASRPDGMPGVQRAYGFTVPRANKKLLTTGTIYQATGSACNFGEIFTTDGRILAQHLTVLADDRKFFPQYNASPVVRHEFVQRYPQVRAVLAPIAEHLDNKTMQRLGAQVDVTGADPAVVARDWMVAEGLVRYRPTT